MASSAVKPCAKDRHESDDISGELLFKSLFGRHFKYLNIGEHLAAHLPNQVDAEAQQPVFVHDRELADSSVEKLTH